ncbi:hypothetical protein BUE80_DR000999, partial [Diplocarpon rosae]
CRRCLCAASDFSRQEGRLLILSTLFPHSGERVDEQARPAHRKLSLDPRSPPRKRHGPGRSRAASRRKSPQQHLYSVRSVCISPLGLLPLFGRHRKSSSRVKLSDESFRSHRQYWGSRFVLQWLERLRPGPQTSIADTASSVHVEAQAEPDKQAYPASRNGPNYISLHMLCSANCGVHLALPTYLPTYHTVCQHTRAYQIHEKASTS